MAADRFCNREPGADALTTLIKVLNRYRLVKVFAEEDRQILLGEADEFLLSLQTGGDCLGLDVQFINTHMIGNCQRGLRSENLQRFHRCAVWAQPVARRIEAQDSQRLAGSVFERQDQ